MAASSIPAVKGALVALIAAALPGTTVTWGVPRGEKGREWVLVGNVTGIQASAAMGRLRRRETYTIEVQVTVVKSNVEAPQDVAERAFELVANIEDALRPDPLVGGIPNLIWALVEKTDLREGFLEKSEERMAEVTVHVGCESRI